MSSCTQAGRPLAITTPLGKDVLLLTGLEGHETISGLFRFQLDLLADRNTPVAFDQVLGQSVTVELEVPPDGKRCFNGIVSRFSQGRRDAHFTHFRAELVPRLWLLTRKVGSRIFQRMTVPEILDTVLAGVPHRLEISGKYEPRDYCTQYRESDFAFVSRLMEEEGIRYYFTHADGSHVMVVSDEAQQHPDVPGPDDLVYDELAGGGRDDEMRVTGWEKAQEVRSDVTTLWDHSFELPGKNLESQQPTIESISVGEVEHKLKLAVGEPLEVYDYPGRYAQRFDGVASGGALRPEELKKIFLDGLRTVRIRMEEEETSGFEIRGASTCRHFTAGHRFTLSRHFDADGPYLLTRVEHRARLEGDYRSGASLPFAYENRFTAIPAALSFRPPRVTPRPAIGGTQTATVVGPAGEELFCDPYGRVKVQFHWDRAGKRDLYSSCWVRVAQTWAGKSWGAFFWPRAGNEVVVAFEEGDPDQPIIVGSVYNAENMPPFPLPLRRELAGIKSASVRGFANQHFNGLVFVDTKGSEHLAIHSQRTMTFSSELDKSFHSGRNKHETVSTFCTETVGSLPRGGGSGGGPAVVRVVDVLPGGGGSGGGIDDKNQFGYTFKGNTQWHPLGFVQPSGDLGLKASTVFGENFSVLCGLGRSATLGHGLSMTVNPAALSTLCGWTVPAPLEAVAGATTGGSANVNLGTKVAFSLGTSYSFSVTDDDRKISLKDNRAAKCIAVLLAAVLFIFLIAYGLLAWDIARTVLTILCDLTLASVLSSLILVSADKDKAITEWEKALEAIFKLREYIRPVRWGDLGAADLCAAFGQGGVPIVASSLLNVATAAIGGGTTFVTGVADATPDAKP
jgi:type VI secretion system secreted protein VgrG